MAGMTILTSAALEAIRRFIQEEIAYAQYKVGEERYKADIQNAEVLPDGRIEITFIIESKASVSTTVTEIQLYDRNGVLLVSKSEMITLSSMHEGILYRFRITVEEW